MHHIQFFPQREIHFGASCRQFPLLRLSQWHWAFKLFNLNAQCICSKLKVVYDFGLKGK